MYNSDNACGKKQYYVTHLKKIKITQLEKVRFIKVNELKINQVELFSFSHFIYVATNAFELFYVAHLANIERFSYHSNFLF